MLRSFLRRIAFFSHIDWTRSRSSSSTTPPSITQCLTAGLRVRKANTSIDPTRPKNKMAGPSSSQQTLQAAGRSRVPAVNSVPIKVPHFAWMAPRGGQSSTPAQQQRATLSPGSKFKLTPNKKERAAAAGAISRPMHQTPAASRSPALTSSASNIMNRPQPSLTSVSKPCKVIKPAATRLGPNRFKLTANKFDKARQASPRGPREPVVNQGTLTPDVSLLQSERLHHLTDQEFLTVAERTTSGQTASAWQVTESYVRARLTFSIRRQALRLGISATYLKASFNEKRKTYGVIGQRAYYGLRPRGTALAGRTDERRLRDLEGVQH